MIIRSAGNVVKKIAIYPTKCVLFTARKEGLHDFYFYIKNVMKIFAPPQPDYNMSQDPQGMSGVDFFFVHCVV